MTARELLMVLDLCTVRSRFGLSRDGMLTSESIISSIKVVAFARNPLPFLNISPWYGNRHTHIEH